MTSKNSCFDRAIFRRSLRRTAPVWGLFCLYELLLPLRLYSYCRGVSVCTEDFFVQAERTILDNAVTGASVVPFVYGGLLAWALFPGCSGRTARISMQPCRSDGGRCF